MAKTYETYSDSGIAWIGEIPSEWKVESLGKIGSFSASGIDKKITATESPIHIINYTDVYNNISHELLNKDYMLVSAPIEKCKEHQVEEGDMIFTPSSETIEDIGVSSVVMENIPNTAYSYHVLRYRCNQLDIQFKKYICNNSFIQNYFSSRATGSIRKTLSRQDFKDCKVIVPPLNEQIKISKYLNNICSEIDSLIALQEEMIGELQSYKQSVITETVTKGLDHNVKMKDSGVEWIGEIPIHWNILPVRAVFNKRNEKNNPVKSTERLSLSIGLGITQYADKTTNLDRFKDDFTQYQLAYPNDIVLNSMNMIVGAVGKSDYMGCVSPVYYVITAKEGNNPDYYGYLLNTPTIRQVYHKLGRGIYSIERGEGRVNTCRLKVPYYDFCIIKIPSPSFNEQCEIAKYLNEKIAEIDTLIKLKEEKIAEFTAYRKSIIYEYVTGKKKV